MPATLPFFRMATSMETCPAVCSLAPVEAATVPSGCDWLKAKERARAAPVATAAAALHSVRLPVPVAVVATLEERWGPASPDGHCREFFSAPWDRLVACANWRRGLCRK